MGKTGIRTLVLKENKMSDDMKTYCKIKEAMKKRDVNKPVPADIIEKANTFLNDILRPDLLKKYKNRIPVLLKTLEGDYHISFTVQKINPKKKSTVSAGEGLIQSSRCAYITDTYVDQREFMYKDLTCMSTENAVACFSLLVDIDNIPEIYRETSDEDRIKLIEEAYPLIFSELEPTYIILSGKKGIHLIYCFNQNMRDWKFHQSYSVLQESLILYFGGDMKRKGMNVIRMPYTRRINMEGCDERCDDPSILFRRAEGPYDYCSLNQITPLA